MYLDGMRIGKGLFDTFSNRQDVDSELNKCERVESFSLGPVLCV